ncbi:MAG: tRNA (N6-isopentenyl adenosine(37)-C2)-methylthiotransferase MiaB [Clostridiales bacterium]|nr:tRNA (N6-isopentenyl adenosine(37)-C2)-methylthiotransferase MiaB [Clostridiales bacterium]
MKIISQNEIDRQYACMEKVRLLNGTGKRVLVRTFGCQQNEADSERLAGMAEAMGYVRADSPDDADLILVNTCAVREHAEQRALSITGQYKHLKEKNPNLIIGVCGCMVTQEHRLNTIKNSYPYVDFLIGTGMLYRFPEILLAHLENDKRLFFNDEVEGNIAEGLPVSRESKIKAWVSVMYGCNNFCTYCVVPYVRGRERSRQPDAILAEVKSLIADGVREITLLGQNVNSYGKDLDCGVDFADLVKEICSLDGDFILRFMTSHPKDANRKLIDTMAECGKCARQFHLPMQSGSGRVLTAMNRRYTPEGYLELIQYMRSRMPDIAISSDIIVGFPGETDAEFEETLEMLKKVQFDMTYSFIYSPRELTPAAKLDCQIPAEVKSARMERLLAVQNEISLAKNLAAVGTIQRVLIEGESKSSADMLTGRADSNKLVHIPRTPESEAKLGSFANIRITRAETFALFGELAD